MSEHQESRDEVEQEVRDLLATVYKPEGVDLWMNGRHRLLEGERPLELIARGQGHRVLAVATQLAESAYA